MFRRSILSLLAAAGAIASASAQDTSIDIGPVGLAGSSTFNGPGSYTVRGAGNDIYGHWDEFHFASFNRTNADLTVTCKVTSFGPSTLESWRKGGLMIRNADPATDVRRRGHAMMMVTGWGAAMQSRVRDLTHSVSVHGSYDTADVWLRLSLEGGNKVTGFVKRDGEYGWMQYAQREIEFGDQVQVGMAVTSHTRETLGVLEVTDFEIQDGAFSLPASPADVGGTGRSVWVQEVKEGVWSVEAGGTDIGGTSDSFGFFGTEHTGDLTATYRLESLKHNNNDSKGGLMIRAGDAADAAHVSVLVKAGDGVRMYHRAETGGPTAMVENVGVWRDNVELRLTKVGNQVEASYKERGAPVDWTVLGTATVDLGVSFKVGQAATSADPARHGKLTGGLVEIVQ